jgi:hypothetical protein
LLLTFTIWCPSAACLQLEEFKKKKQQQQQAKASKPDAGGL